MDRNRHFPEFHSEILGVPRKVVLKFRKIGIIPGRPSFSEPGNRTQHGCLKSLMLLSDRRLNRLLDITAVEWS